LNIPGQIMSPRFIDLQRSSETGESVYPAQGDSGN